MVTVLDSIGDGGTLGRVVVLMLVGLEDDLYGSGMGEMLYLYVPYLGLNSMLYWCLRDLSM